MSYIFEIVDKTGRKIHLTKERWTHITEPASPHPHMAAYLDKIKNVLIKPDIILPSKYDDKKANYYKFFKEKKQYLRIIVKYLNSDGFVISAYFVRNISK